MTRFRWTSRPAALLWMAAFLLLAACGSPPPPPDLPRLAEIRSNSTPPPPPAIDDAATRLDLAGRVLLNVTRFDLPLDQPLNGLWDVVDEDAIAPLARGVWNRNGLRIGVLSTAQLDAFNGQLPAGFAEQTTQMIASSHLVPVRSSPRLRESVRVDLTIPPLAVRETFANRGRLRLLLGADVSDDRPTLLRLVPQQYVPRSTLLPRNPLEKELDGRVFEDLAVRIAAQPTRLVVVGLYWPWAPAVDPNDANPFRTPPPSPPLSGDGEPADDTEAAEASETVEPADEAAADPESEPLLEPPPLLNHLGRALFTGVRFNQRFQMLLVIAVVDAD